MQCWALLTAIILATSVHSSVASANDTVALLKERNVSAFDIGMVLLERDLKDFQSNDNFYSRLPKRNDIIYSTFAAYNPQNGVITLGITAYKYPSSNQPWDVTQDCQEKLLHTRIWAGYDPSSGTFIRERSNIMKTFFDLVDGSHNPFPWKNDIAEVVVVLFSATQNGKTISCRGNLMSSEYELAAD